MPEFILDHGSPEGARTFHTLDAFTQGYVEALFFTDASDPDDGDLADATVAELAPDALELIRRECAAFQSVAATLLERAYERPGYDEAAAGRDFWFTRNGHGVGFWDRDALRDDGLGDTLSTLCGWRTPFGTRDVYRGDDGLVYLS